MARPKKEFKLVTLTFRVDPLLMHTFHTHCDQANTTRSEAIREILNNYMNNLKKHEDETNDCKQFE